MEERVLRLVPEDLIDRADLQRQKERRLGLVPRQQPVNLLNVNDNLSMLVHSQSSDGSPKKEYTGSRDILPVRPDPPR